MSKKAVNRLKAVLADQGKMNRWLAEKLEKNETTICRWYTSAAQSSMENLVEITTLLQVDVRELTHSSKNIK